jgi:DUF1680 family protein
MRTKFLFHFMPVLLAAIAVMLSCAAFAQENSDNESDSVVNLAIVAEPSSSYVSGDTRLSALNDGYNPGRSRDNSRGSYGNWNRTGTQWVQYDWNQPISTNKIDIYWWSDGRGIHPPSASRLLYWDGSSFVPVNNPSGLGVEVDKYNTTTFDEVSTSKLRLEIDSDGRNSTGILEWKVYDSGKSPAFPPTVEAGVDRVVMPKGKTYLSGAIKTLGNKDALKVTWSKASGPGDVTFENANSTDTTATFSAPGDYVLKLTAAKDQLNGSSTLNVKVEPLPPSKSLEPIHTKNFKINSPFWNNRIKAQIVNWIPHCIDKISDPNLREGGMNNIIDAAKTLRGESLEEGHGHRGYVFSNAWIFNTIESICIALMVEPQGDREIIRAQNKMKRTLDDWIPKILSAQDKDGYIQTAFMMRRVSRNEDGTYRYYNGPFERWARRGDHEGYVAGYFLEAGIAHHLLTEGKDVRLYNAAQKLADCWYDNIGPAPKKQWYDGHQAMEIALVRFGRYVNEVEGKGKGNKYIELAKFLLDCRRDGSEYDQSHLPVQQQYEAVGHAVRASYSYAGMADIAIETKDIDYMSAIMSLWDNIVSKKYYITGGIGSGESSEGFGPNYSLRNNAYCESCSSCGEIFFQHKLNRLYHDAKYADLYEETLYNALLGSMDLEGKNFYYQNPLISRGSRYDWHGCPCCVGNIPRALLSLPTWMYLKDSENIYVNLFIGSTVTIENIAGTDVEMVQETDYPWNGKVTITVNPAIKKKFSVRIRVPDRDVSSLYTCMPDSDGISSISVNGSSIAAKIEKGYAVINRKWKAGDKIELLLPMMVQRVKASKKITADIDRVALRYGPLIYNVESVDQNINQVLKPDSALTTEWKDKLLEGVVVIEGKWADGSDLTAIPNYARNNREATSSQSRDFGGPGTTGSGRDRGRRLAGSIVWIKDQ